jgi:hypothetical protein
MSGASAKFYRLFDIRRYFRTTLLGSLEYDARLVLVTRNTVAFKQHTVDGMLYPRRPFNGFMGWRVAGDLTSQSFIMSRSDLNEYFHSLR